MFETSRTVLLNLGSILRQVPPQVYTRPCPALSGATIGQHTRHVIEMYQVLLNNYEQGLVCYDKRPRDPRIEQDVHHAVTLLKQLAYHLEREDRKLLLVYTLNGSTSKIPTRYFRELMYNLEHAIHHEALLRIALEAFTDIELPVSFGVAPSTIEYREQCAQ